MKNVLITGATGFIGRRLAHQLLDEGYEVTVLARESAHAADLAHRGARVIEGDLSQSLLIENAMDDVDGVFHLAAACDLGGELGPMRRINVEGTRNIINAATDAGVARIVYGGCDTSLGDTYGAVCDESKEHDGNFESVYEQTEQETHLLVRQCIEQGAPIINAIVSTAYGPGDEGPIGALIEQHVAGRRAAHVDRDAGYTFTHVDDVATGLRLAYERGEAGEDYLLSGTPASFEEFFDALSAQTGISRPHAELPMWLLDAMEPLAEHTTPVFKKTGAEVREMIAISRGVTRYFSSQKAREELDWQPRSLEDGLRDTLPWFQLREKESTDRLLQSTSVPLLGLSAFDIGLGMSALVFPGFYSQIMHPHAGAAHLPATRALLARMGLTWLFFAAVQGTAGLDPVERPEWVMIAGALRLMDVPADLGYFLKSDDQGWLGKAGLLAAPVFNLGVGAFLTYAGYRGLRAKYARR